MKKILFTLNVLALFFLPNGPFGKVAAQTVTLSAPASSATYVDTVTTLFTISEPSGTPQQIQVVFTYASGYYTNAVGNVWTLTMKANNPAPGAFSFSPTNLTNAAYPFTVSTNTPMLEGYYSIYCQYVRPASAGGATVKSSTKSNVYMDLLTLPPAFTLAAAVTVNTSTSTITLTNHLLANNSPVTLSGMNAGTTNTYYVSVVDSNSFNLFTTAGGSNYLTLTPNTSPAVIYPPLAANSRYGGNTALIYYTLSELPLAGSINVTFAGASNVTLTLANNSSNRFVLNRTNIMTSGAITASSATNLPDGNYNLAISYQDRFGHAAAVTTVTNVLFESTTPPPVFTSLASGSTISDGSAISYLLPETPLSGSVLLVFNNGSSNVVYAMSDATSNQFVFSVANDGALLPSGNYSITLSYSDNLGNPASSATVANVNLAGLPVINGDPTNVTAVIGSNVTFQVGTSDVNAHTYQWFYSDADPLATAGGYALTYADFVYGVQLTNAGYGYFQVPNVQFAGGGGSGVAGFATVSNGSVTSITITNAGYAYTAAPAVTIDPPQTLLAGQTNATLMVSNFGPVNLGSYWVVVSDAYGSVTSSVAGTTLSPATPPEAPGVLVPPAGTNVPLHGSVTLSVTASGTLPFEYQWSQGGTNLPSATNSTLRMYDFRSPNVGAYAVVISSPYGSVTSSVAQVSMLPSFTRQFTGLTQVWGQPGTLSVSAVGTGTLQYQWYFNGQPIDGATESSYSMGNLQFTNAGSYSLVVTSQFGSVTNAAYQVVVEPANIRLGLFAGVVIDGTVGNSFAIQSISDLSATNQWATVTNLTLTQPEQVWFDINADTLLPQNPRRFYRVMALP